MEQPVADSDARAAAVAFNDLYRLDTAIFRWTLLGPDADAAGGGSGAAGPAQTYPSARCGTDTGMGSGSQAGGGQGWTPSHTDTSPLLPSRPRRSASSESTLLVGLAARKKG